MTTASVEEYLEAIYKQQQREHPVRVSKLASALGVAPASATEMTKRLADEGYVNRSEGVGVCLTQKGRDAALRTVRKHRLVERFLTDVLGLPWDRVHDEACLFEHVVSDEVEQSLEKLLEEPTRCPHGYPIPDKDGNVPIDATKLLADIPVGGSAKVVAVDEEDPAMLSYLASLGLMPGVEIAVCEVAPFGGPLLVEVKGARYAIGREVACRLFVEEDGSRRGGRARRGRGGAGLKRAGRAASEKGAGRGAAQGAGGAAGAKKGRLAARRKEADAQAKDTADDSAAGEKPARTRKQARVLGRKKERGA